MCTYPREAYTHVHTYSTWEAHCGEDRSYYHHVTEQTVILIGRVDRCMLVIEILLDSVTGCKFPAFLDHEYCVVHPCIHALNPGGMSLKGRSREFGNCMNL